MAENHLKEKKAFRACERKDRRAGLGDEAGGRGVHLSTTPKILFYFTAGGRVDFRELVKDLAGCSRTRIELRQIGVRDEAQNAGGLGICGRPLLLRHVFWGFSPVSIKMAKEQGLSLTR